MKQTAYIVDDGQKMVIPNLLSVNRTEDKTAEEILENSSFKDLGFTIIEYEWEGYRDTSVGTIVFNKTSLPQNRCEEFHSVAEITDGLLFRSKLDNFFIYKYSRDGESVAITLNQNTRSCGRKLYQTGIPSVHVLILEDTEGFLDNKNLRLVEMEDDILFEAEIRDAMNSAFERMWVSKTEYYYISSTLKGQSGSS